MIEFKIPFLPLSENESYTWYAKSKKLTARAKKYLSDVQLFTPPIELDKDKKYSITIILRGNWINKNGTFKKKDAQNYDKLLIDAICLKAGVDDCVFWTIVISKEQADCNETIVFISE